MSFIRPNQLLKSNNTISKFQEGGIATLSNDELDEKIAELKSSIATTNDEMVKEWLEESLQDLINQKLNDNQNIDFLINGNWFKDYPEKLIGQEKIAKNRYGDTITFLDGNISLVKDNPIYQKHIEYIEQLLENSTKVESFDEKDLAENFIKNIIDESNANIGRKIKAKTIKIDAQEDVELQNIETIFKNLNENISEIELQAYVWYKNSIGQRLSDIYYQLSNYPKGSEVEIGDQLAKDKVLFYFKGKLYPESIYCSGDIYQKVSAIKNIDGTPSKEGQFIIDTYGIEAYENQNKTLFNTYNRLYEQRLIITGNDQGNSLILKPISEFAKTHVIKEINSMSEFRWLKETRNVPKRGLPRLEETWFSIQDTKTFESLTLQQAFSLWLADNRNTIAFNYNLTYYDIIYFYLDKRRKNAPKNATEEQKEKFNRNIELKKQHTREEGNRLFLLFLDTELSQNQKTEIEYKWNSRFNNYVPIDYTKIPVVIQVTQNFHGEDPFIIKKEKREAISFLFNEGSGCLAYDVGVGKTMSAIMAIEQFTIAGYCKRPFIIVPNQTYNQWIEEIKNILPHRQINDLYNLSAKYLKGLEDKSGNIRMVAENSISVMTYSGFKNLTILENTQSEIEAKLYDILEQQEEMSKKKTATFQNKIKSLLGVAKIKGKIAIETLGFDHITFDEAHNIKKLFTSVKAGKDKKKHYAISSGTPSNTALKSFIMTQYVMANNNNRNVFLLTATPFTNSALEIYSMLSYIGQHHLESLGLGNLQMFFDNFVDVQSELVIDHTLTPKLKEVIKGFTNLPSLQSIIYRFFNYKTGEDVGVIRPKKYVIPYTKENIDGTIVELPINKKVESYLPLNSIQEEMMRNVLDFASGNISEADLGTVGYIDEDEDPEGSVVQEFETTADTRKAGVRALMSMGFSQQIAFSPYAFKFTNVQPGSYKEFVENSPKILYTLKCIENVKKHHEGLNEQISGQVIFSNRGNKYFPLIKEYLIKEIGYKKHEVQIIIGKTPKKKKEEIQDAFLGKKLNSKTRDYEKLSDEKRVKVIIGSASIKEGMNLQRYSSCLYSLTVDWNPTDFQQLAGRIWRQKNIFEGIRIVMPLASDSIDIFLFQKLEEKTSRINSIWSNDGRSSIKIEELDNNEIKFALIKNPETIAKLEVEEKAQKVGFKLSSIGALKERVEELETNLRMVKGFEEDAKKWANNFKPSLNINSVDDILKAISLMAKWKNKPKDLEGKQVPIESRDIYNIEQFAETNKIKVSDVSLIRDYYFPFAFSRTANNARKLKKDIKELLMPRGYDVNNFENLRNDLDAEYKDVQSELEYLKSDNYIEERTQSIIKEKEKLQVQDQNIDQAVKSFEKLNYLLDEKMLSSDFGPKTTKDSSTELIIEEQTEKEATPEELETAKDVVGILLETETDKEEIKKLENALETINILLS